VLAQARDDVGKDAAADEDRCGMAVSVEGM
jgi:hypothetical protein